MRRALAATLLATLALAPVAGAVKPRASAGARQAAPGPRAERARYLMGTVCYAQAQDQASDTARAGRAIEAAFEEIARLDTVMSSWNDQSELQRLNATGAGDRIACSDDLFAVIAAALHAAEETDGAFDPTIEPLNRIWDMRGVGRRPDPTELADVRPLVNWRLVVAEPGRKTVRYLKAGVGLDLGGIGKGYALDRAAALLRERRVPRALLNFGGEILALTNQEAWHVTVADPADRLRPVVRMALSNGAISTSSQVERGIETDRGFVGHIFDARLLGPSPTRASVSVVTRSATRADALSTALLVMGRERAFEFARAHTDIGLLWLEPGEGQVLAWASNLPALTAEPGVRVHWMHTP